MKVEKSSCSDFLTISKMLDWAGLGFGENENYKISLALKRLLKKSLPKNL